MRHALGPCLLLVAAVGIPAQHIVGPGGLPQIGSALAIAAPGATIHVLPGVYAPFTAGFGCTIRALTPGTVTIAPAGSLVTTTLAAPAGQTVHLVGLTFDDPAAFGTSVVRVTSGRATLDQCTLTTLLGAPLVVQDASIHLQACTVAANGHLGVRPGLLATNSYVTAIDTTFRGSPITSLPHPTGQPGVSLVGSNFHASGCSIFSGMEFLTPALRASGGQVWLSDSTLVGTTCPIQATGTVLADRCSLQPLLVGCAPPGGGLLGVSRPNALHQGAGFDLTYRTVANGYAAVFASQELATLAIPGLHAETQWLGGGIVNLGVVFADGSGQAQASWTIPAGTWLIDQPLWFQGLTGFALPLQLSPVAGGVIR